MADPRFYIPDCNAAVGECVTLPDAAAHHAMRVLRMREGDPVRIFTGRGIEAHGPIHFYKDGASVEISSVSETACGKLRITLLQALVSNEKMDWIVEKACETGVSRIVVYSAARGEVKVNKEKAEKKLERFRKTVVSACMQCGQNWMPEIVYADRFEEALTLAEGRRFVTAPSLEASPAGSLEGNTVSFLIGPEGGLTPQEIDTAVKNGFEPRLLGPRVLRTETAGIAAAVWTQTLWGDYI